MTDTSGAGTAAGHGEGTSRRPRSVRAYLLGLVVVFTVTMGSALVHQRSAALHDARRAVLEDARYGATGAARDIGEALEQAASLVTQSAVHPSIVRMLTTPAECALGFSGADPFEFGHLAVVRADGSVVCSSNTLPATADYQGAAWLTPALRELTITAPVLDTRTNMQVVVVAAPIQDKGVLAAFFNLDGMGLEVADDRGGARQLEFLVTSADGKTSIARSIRSLTWAGHALADTPFARATDPVDRPDVDGVRRLYGEARVPQHGWKVYAGADRAEALADVHRLLRRESEIGFAGFLVFLLAAWVTHRRLTAQPAGES